MNQIWTWKPTLPQGSDVRCSASAYWYTRGDYYMLLLIKSYLEAAGLVLWYHMVRCSQLPPTLRDVLPSIPQKNCVMCGHENT